MPIKLILDMECDMSAEAAFSQIVAHFGDRFTVWANTSDLGGDFQSGLCVQAYDNLCRDAKMVEDIFQVARERAYPDYANVDLSLHYYREENIDDKIIDICKLVFFAMTNLRADCILSSEVTLSPYLLAHQGQLFINDRDRDLVGVSGRYISEVEEFKGQFQNLGIPFTTLRIDE